MLLACGIVILSACGNSQSASDFGLDDSVDPAAIMDCQSAVAEAFANCSADIIAAQAQCIDSDAETCADGEAAHTAIEALRLAVADNCPTDSVVRDAGFGKAITVSGLQGLLGFECTSAAHRVVARTFGGPQMKLLDDNQGDAAALDCLQTSYDEASTLFAASYANYSSCALDADCSIDPAAEAANDLAAGESAIISNCIAPRFEDLNGSSPALFLQRTLEQARCAVASSHATVGFVGLRCGPDNQNLEGIEIRDESGNAVSGPIADLPRGEHFQLVLDESVWGSVCGDGSPYAPWLRWAPEGSDRRRVLVHLEGGGACAAGTCVNASADKFESLSRTPGTSLGGYMRVRDDNSLGDRTLLFLPFCTQDLHIGGGVVDPGPGPDGGPINRHGAVNVRAALDMLRDVLWGVARQSASDGFRSDALDVVFAGTSSGAYGVQYNLQYVLDDLRWVNTLASAHAAVVIGGGAVPNFDAFFAVVKPTWGLQGYMPPYCFADNCATSGMMLPAHAERLLEQQRQILLVSSAQHDTVQERTQGFIVPLAGPTIADNGDQWINGLRSLYCDLKGTPGLNFFLPSNTIEGIHGIVNKDEFHDRAAAETVEMLADGVHLYDWLGTIADVDIASAVDRVEEGNLVSFKSGVMPFECSVLPDPEGN